MMFRKLFLVFAIVAGLCSFDTPVESQRLPQVPQTELVVSEQKEVTVAGKILPEPRQFFVYNEASLVSFHHHYNHSLLIQSQQRHASL